jgi:hypothetical protein
MNDLNDDYELENLIENIKQTWIQDYKSCYDNKEDGFKNETALFNPVS